MNYSLLTCLCFGLVLLVPAHEALAERTDVEVRVLARGAKFLGGYAAPVRVQLIDADTGETLAQGLTVGTTGDTATIMGPVNGRDALLSSPGSAVFSASLDIDRPRRVTLSATGPLSQPQATTTATSQQWILPGKHLTAGDGWRVELPGLIVDLAEPVAYSQVRVGQVIPIRAGVSLLCGCNLSESGPWRAAEVDSEVYLTVNGGMPKRIALAFDPADTTFKAMLTAEVAGLYELEVRAWMASNNNAGVARTAFFVR